MVGTNVIEAMILAALGKPPESVSDDDFVEIIDELDIRPRLLHPTGRFRNIRRFAFVIHPLSQEFIKKGFPIPKATPKFIMDRVETMAAHMPPMVYCKMSNIVSPTGAEAEGWLISVGGTPKETPVPGARAQGLRPGQASAGAGGPAWRRRPHAAAGRR